MKNNEKMSGAMDAVTTMMVYYIKSLEESGVNNMDSIKEIAAKELGESLGLSIKTIQQAAEIAKIPSANESLVKCIGILSNMKETGKLDDEAIELVCTILQTLTG